MRFAVKLGVCLLLSVCWFMSPTHAQTDLKAPNCVDPQDANERVCCQALVAQICAQMGYTEPGDQSTQASSIPPLTDIDILEPLGVAIGMQFSELDAEMKAMGLRRSGCGWTSYLSEDVSITVGVNLVSPTDGSPMLQCVQDLPVHSLSVRQTESRGEVFANLPLPAAMVPGWLGRFGRPVNDCNAPYSAAGSFSTVRCMFDDADPSLQRLTLEYGHSPSQRTVYMAIGLYGISGAVQSTEDDRTGRDAAQSAEAVLQRDMSNPIQAAVICTNISTALRVGNDFTLDGVTIVDQGRMLVDMPAACN